MDGWKIASYYQKGLSHQESGQECQDYVLTDVSEYGIVAALADGLGSLCYSEIAAQAAVEACCDYLIDRDISFDEFQSEEFQRSLINHIVTVVRSTADDSGISYRDLDCTFVFIYISVCNDYAVVGRLGDSAVCIIKNQVEDSIVLSESKRSANGTSAILDTDVFDLFEIQLFNENLNEIMGFILCSDGLDSVIYMKGSSRIRKAAEDYINEVSMSADIQEASEVLRRRIGKLVEDDPFYDDDISIAIISRPNCVISLPEEPTWLCTCGTRNTLDNTYCTNCQNDFVFLYKNIKFPKYGGKENYFSELNKDPEKEASLIGLTYPKASAEADETSNCGAEGKTLQQAIDDVNEEGKKEVHHDEDAENITLESNTGTYELNSVIHKKSDTVRQEIEKLRYYQAKKMELELETEQIRVKINRKRREQIEKQIEFYENEIRKIIYGSKEG